MNERKKLYHGTLAQFKNLDESFLRESAYPVEILIESVGAEMGLKLKSILEKKKFEIETKIVFLLGRGNNAADGLVLARWLFQRGFKEMSVVFLSEQERLSRLTMEKLRFFSIVVENPEKIIFTKDFQCVYSLLENAELIVDGLYGTGFNGSLSPYEKKVVKDGVNALYDKKLIVSIDIPSALNAENKEETLLAHHTLSVAGYKDLFFSSVNKPYVGKVHLIKADFPESFLEKELNYVLLPENKTSDKKEWENKYSRGVSLIIGASSQYQGALYMNTGGALRGGAGYLKILSPNTLNMEDFPQVVLMNKKSNPYMTKEIYETFREEIESEKIKNILIGSGLDRNEETKPFFEVIMDLRSKKIILDGDGLYFIKDWVKNPRYKAWKEQNEILFTPHWGEFLSLMQMDKKSSLDELFSYIEEFRDQYGVSLLLKDAGTIFLCSSEKKAPPIFLENKSLYLSKAGSGDILAGLILGRLSYHKDLMTAAESAVLQFITLGKNIEKNFGESAPITYLYNKI